MDCGDWIGSMWNRVLQMFGNRRILVREEDL